MNGTTNEAEKMEDDEVKSLLERLTSPKVLRASLLTQ
jgi:hypothetical protein